jgi:hypothetical protein
MVPWVSTNLIVFSALLPISSTLVGRVVSGSRDVATFVLIGIGGKFNCKDWATAWQCWWSWEHFCSWFCTQDSDAIELLAVQAVAKLTISQNKRASRVESFCSYLGSQGIARCISRQNLSNILSLAKFNARLAECACARKRIRSRLVSFEFIYSRFIGAFGTLGYRIGRQYKVDVWVESLE